MGPYFFEIMDLEPDIDINDRGKQNVLTYRTQDKTDEAEPKGL